MRIIGMSGDYIRHDSSICYVEDGKVKYACMEERFSGLKNDPRAPLLVLNDVLERFDLCQEDIDYFAVGLPPFNVFGELLDAGPKLLGETLGALALKAPLQFTRYCFDRKADGTPRRSGFEWLDQDRVRYISHYLAHAASAYRTSHFDKALCVTLDAAGADEKGNPYSGAVFTCENGQMKQVETISRFTSIACFYNAVTQACAFNSVGEDWKLMGLSAFGDHEPCLAEMKELTPKFHGGQWHPSRYSMEAKFIDRPLLFRNTSLWHRLSALVDRHGDRNVAAAAQRAFEDEMLAFFEHLLKQYPNTNIVMAGGAFHNIKFLMRFREQRPDLVLHTHPACGDPGTALGAAMELYSRLNGEPVMDPLDSMALGPDYSDNEMLAALTAYQDHVVWERPKDVPGEIAKLLSEGQVMGLFQGRSEWGPRALGQRSVIADPRNREMQVRINSRLKNREWFMPFAPSVLEESMHEYFDDCYYSPYMTTAFRVKEKGRSDLPAAVHLDMTARPQIVRQSVLPHYHAIIDGFRKITGVGAVLNTSFNRHGLPMVNSPEDAVKHLMWGCVDKLALGPFIASRKGDVVDYKKRMTLSTDVFIKKESPFDDRLQKVRTQRAEAGEEFKEKFDTWWK